MTDIRYKKLQKILPDVSHETFQKLVSYEETLKKWQKKINLVSNNTIDTTWERHFVDSIQMYNLIPQGTTNLADFGSGAGFPGLVLALLSTENNNVFDVTLIESDLRKTLFLKEVARINSINVEIVNKRIEKTEYCLYDVVTARALASLDLLFKYSAPFLKENSKLIFLKGQSYKEEIAEAKKNWVFDCEEQKSITNPESVILTITNLKPHGG